MQCRMSFDVYFFLRIFLCFVWMAARVFGGMAFSHLALSRVCGARVAHGCVRGVGREMTMGMPLWAAYPRPSTAHINSTHQQHTSTTHINNTHQQHTSSTHINNTSHTSLDNWVITFLNGRFCIRHYFVHGRLFDFTLYRNILAGDRDEVMTSYMEFSHLLFP